jgi:hypothetical protein
VTVTYDGGVAASHTLTVTKSGAGSGTVTSSPAGIDCGATCTHAYDQGTSVTLTASPATGSTFGGWSGACSGSGPCTVTISADLAVTATYTTPGPPPGPPSASIITPANGSSYQRGTVQSASYSCQDPAGAPGIQSCTGTEPNGSPLDTSTPGPHSFTVTAKSQDGQAATAATTYTVVTAANTKATISKLLETNAVFAVGHLSTPTAGQTAAAGHKHGTVFSFSLDRAATIKIALQTHAYGRRAGRTCKPATHALRRKPRCTRTITIATLTRTAHSGPNSVAFTGRIGGKPFRPGNYEAVITATDSAGQSPAQTLRFTIAKR